MQGRSSGLKHCDRVPVPAHDQQCMPTRPLPTRAQALYSYLYRWYLSSTAACNLSACMCRCSQLSQCPRQADSVSISVADVGCIQRDQAASQSRRGRGGSLRWRPGGTPAQPHWQHLRGTRDDSNTNINGALPV